MTLLEAIETEVANLSRKCRFEYAGDLNEANANIFDKLATGDFPVCLVLAFDINDSDRATTRINSEAEVNILFLDRLTSEQTIDQPTSKLESAIIAPMRALTRELVNRLDKNDIITEDGISSLVNRNTWQAIGDAHLLGNWAVIQIKFSEDISTKICD
jgi:hypothetical protein